MHEHTMSMFNGIPKSFFNDPFSSNGSNDNGEQHGFVKVHFFKNPFFSGEPDHGNLGEPSGFLKEDPMPIHIQTVSITGGKL